MVEAVTGRWPATDSGVQVYSYTNPLIHYHLPCTRTLTVQLEEPTTLPPYVTFRATAV